MRLSLLDPSTKPPRSAGPGATGRPYSADLCSSDGQVSEYRDWHDTARGLAAFMRLSVLDPSPIVRQIRPAIVRPFRLTIIHPCIGRKPGQKYIRTWQMEPLPAATLAGLTPKGVDIRFYDDRMENIPFDQPADLVATRCRDVHSQSGVSNRQRIPPAWRAGGHGRISRLALPGRSRGIRRRRRDW